MGSGFGRTARMLRGEPPGVRVGMPGEPRQVGGGGVLVEERLGDRHTFDGHPVALTVEAFGFVDAATASFDPGTELGGVPVVPVDEPRRPPLDVSGQLTAAGEPGDEIGQVRLEVRDVGIFAVLVPGSSDRPQQLSDLDDGVAGRPLGGGSRADGVVARP